MLLGSIFDHWLCHLVEDLVLAANTFEEPSSEVSVGYSAHNPASNHHEVQHAVELRVS